MAITQVYNKIRSTCGRQPMFSVGRTDMCDTIQPDPVEQRRYILRNPVHTMTQHTPNFSRCEINTIRAEFTTSGANHAEGGWPDYINLNDPEATQRYRRKIEKDDGYIHCVSSLASGFEHLILQNNAIGMYETYYAELPSMPPVETISCRTVNVYIPPGHPRPITSICWMPEGGSYFAVTYVDVDFYREARSRSPIAAYIWDIENANHPDRTLMPPCPVLDLQYNQKDVNVIAGGLMNGSVAIWDTRRPSDLPTSTSAPHIAHRDYVRNVRFINAKNGMEFFSGSPDGVVKWWDMRNMNATIDEMIIQVVSSAFEVQTMAKAEGISALEFEPTIPSRYMVGTENGFVVSGNRKGKSAWDKLPAKYPAHLGPLWRVERSPGFLKNFLTVGDWTAKVWSEDCKDSPIIWTSPSRQRVCDGTWSPTRLSLLLLAQFDGRLRLWDLLRSQHAPVLTVEVCEEPLVRAQVHEGGIYVACGSAKGKIYMQELSTSLAITGKNDKVMMTLIMERESKRERILETRLREVNLKRRQAEEGSPVHSTTDLDATIGDKDLLDATQEYMQITKKELAAL